MVTPQDHLYRVTRILTLATPTSAKTSVLNTIPPPRYVLIADRYGSGNLLGLLNSDRLLAYLRVRMRNLPTPSSLNVSRHASSIIFTVESGIFHHEGVCMIGNS